MGISFVRTEYFVSTRQPRVCSCVLLSYVPFLYWSIIAFTSGYNFHLMRGLVQVDNEIKFNLHCKLLHDTYLHFLMLKRHDELPVLLPLWMTKRKMHFNVSPWNWRNIHTFFFQIVGSFQVMYVCSQCCRSNNKCMHGIRHFGFELRYSLWPFQVTLQETNNFNWFTCFT